MTLKKKLPPQKVSDKQVEDYMTSVRVRCCASPNDV